MFTLPAFLYLKLLPLFGQCLYNLIVPNKSRPPHAGGALPAGPLPALHPFCARASVGIFAPHQREDIWSLRIGSSVESGFEPATLRSRGRDLTTRPPQL
ncbi:hypothetical protein AVEN_250405-1 [Araneus ventricosus]|uniref:Secreted protein n=1 Tax=Araneus ventricosus TaxID=182803 RepID=A0A4Y2R782_ARAVE|nr:hypothetical protein AVEN_250405-1 [Araneus ventricosus]